ncbi:hypothetical protein [Halorussus amylolyticus]|uniref:hypothetical protein n=1 Tax=Halorussus amylolyticus TaxID=1126242 RepID=UPI0010468762|nr:hypothetical protein [Halorussus amylolyticus]
MYLIGTDDTHVGVWLSEDLARLLATTEAIVTDSETMLTFRTGPSYLVIEPHDDAETVNLTQFLLYSGVEDPDKRLPIEETSTVSKQAWIEELVRVNPDMVRVTAAFPEGEGSAVKQWSSGLEKR